MRRREFMALLGGVAVARPIAAGAQQPSQMRRIDVLTQGSISTHPTSQFRIFLKTLQETGWDEGRNLKAGHLNHPYRVHAGRRSGALRYRHKPGATGLLNLVWLWFRSPHLGLAARTMLTS
jgi:hypothetical protein